MRPEQVKAWLGLPPGAVMRDAEWWERVCEGMKDVPQPPAGPADENITAFTAFLACSGPAPARHAALADAAGKGEPDAEAG